MGETLCVCLTKSDKHHTFNHCSPAPKLSPTCPGRLREHPSAPASLQHTILYVVKGHDMVLSTTT